MAFLFAILSPRVLQFSFILFGAIGGPILAVFTLGILMPCINSMGAAVAFVSSVIVGLALGVGSILNPVFTTNLPLSVENCTTNITISIPSNSTGSPSANSWSIYSLSYLYYSLVCLLTAVVVGLAVSAVSGMLLVKKYESNQYILPLV
ncbi:Sodium-coupled monocarboxylate transporter 1 [Fasciolopsis buskii]|uniref:Sodium-coupled monocarboxylate transporter 1 n=1 Tax=Fasciolopsis buskii TaxID=27845 RepID=A0A8E0RQL6_9TREM|nr:Sodium-coupled monocarboxylate transporter 1 [Fasciolopsis buski]